MGDEFKYIEKWIKGDMQGVDVGCGTNRLSMEVLAIDQNPDRKYAHADVVHNCHDLDIGKEIHFNNMKYTFKDGTLDFVFSSHCLEDFDDIDVVFKNWWNKIKEGGLMILMLPDMEPCECEKCTSEAQVKYRNRKGLKNRYWTVEEYEKTGNGNPSHRTNVGKKFINELLQSFKEKHEIDYEILQEDTIPHDASCSIDFVIRKIK